MNSYPFMLENCLASQTGKYLKLQFNKGVSQTYSSDV